MSATVTAGGLLDITRLVTSPLVSQAVTCETVPLACRQWASVFQRVVANSEIDETRP
jgi:hypothetical protein